MIRHMVYVMCDSCGKPASDVCDDGKEARRMVPADWVRTSAYGPRRDLCPKCAYDDKEADHDEGCPEGMYPLDSSWPANDYDTFEELRANAERASDVLNLPLSWFFDDGEYDEEGPSFTLVFLMPRKYGQRWSMRTRRFDRFTVQAWLDTWLRGEINRWFGWTESGATR